MTILQAILLGLIQGVTEFLPISSSGHLVLFESLLRLDVDTLKSFDVALHVGSLVAILLYFRKRIHKILMKEQHYIGWLVIGTVPAVIIGLTLEDKIDAMFRGSLAVGIMMAIVGVYFLFAEKFKPKKEKKMNAKKIMTIGIAQAFALIPGVSRSGSTIATGLLGGIERREAAEISFLLGSIAIAGAGALTAKDVYSEGLPLIAMKPLLLGTLASFLASYFAIKFLMFFFKKNTLKPFAYYLFIVSALTIYFSLA